MTSNRTALVTGASRGIGRAIALRLSRDGFSIVANYAGNKKLADELVAEIESAGGHAIAAQGDVAEPTDMARVFDAAQERFGRLDVVVNSAGIMPTGPIANRDVEMFDRVIRTNLRGTFIVLGEAARRLPEGGRIIALSTSAIAKSLPGYGPYIASKEGVEGLVRVLANELRGRGITVNAIAPGPVGTDLFLDGKTPQQIDFLAKLAPLERIGTPDEIAAAVAFIASPEGGWVNAQVVRVNGGFA